MSRAILKNISVFGTVHRLARVPLVVAFAAIWAALILSFSASLAHAADTLPGDACTGAELNHIRSNAGKASDGSSYNLVYCDGTSWVGMLSGNATGLQAPSSMALTGDISPAQINAAQNNYDPAGLSTATVLRLSTDASRDITGLAGGADGRTLVLLNVGSNPIVLKNQSASSTAANRFALGADLTLTADQGTSLIYDSTSQRWRAGMLPFDQGGGGFGSAACAPTANNPQYVETNSSSGTYTLASYAVPSLTNRTLVVTFHADNGVNPTGVTFGGTPLTKAADADYGPALAAIWYLVNPTVSTADIVVTMGGAPLRSAITAVTLDCTNQCITPFSATVISNSTTTNTSINTWFENTMVIDAITNDNPGAGAPTVTQGPDQVAIRSANSIGGGSTAYGSSTKLAASVGSTTLGWSNLLADEQAHVLAAFLPAMTAGGGSCDPCDPANSPTPGTICTDGTIYAGTTVGGVPMYAARCDHGQSWDGAACTGARISLQWKTANTATAGTSSNTDGVANTDAMATAGIALHPAAEACRNLGAIWYLPAIFEMNTLHTNIGTSNFDTSGAYYWSSTQYFIGTTDGRTKQFSPVGTLSNSFKTSTRHVRCVRR